MFTAGGVLQRRWDLRSYLRYLSPHADGHTPGPLQVLLPFASLQALAFPQHSKGRRVFRPRRIYPFVGLSQLYPSDQMSRGCTIRFMLRPAVLAGPPDWVGHALCMPSRDRVGASSTRVLPHEPALCLLIQKGN